MANDLRVGDTHRTDEQPALVENVDPYWPEPQGDRPKEGYVSEVDIPDNAMPTASELRKAGYAVPEDVKGSDAPALLISDTPTAPGEVHLVDMPQDAGDSLTTNERIAETGKGSKVDRTDGNSPAQAARADNLKADKSGKTIGPDRR